MLSFIEKTQFSKSSSPDKEESGRDTKDVSTDNDTWRAAVSQVMCIDCLISSLQTVRTQLCSATIFRYIIHTDLITHGSLIIFAAVKNINSFLMTAKITACEYGFNGLWCNV